MILNFPTQLVFRFDNPEEQSFATFAAGQNGLLVSLLENIAANEAEQLIVLWGEQGVGKTHLLMAAGARAAEYGLRVSYVPCNEYIAALPMMLDGLEQRDLVLFDNVDLLEQNLIAEEALFHCLNKLREANIKILVTAKKPPQQMSIALADIRSRFGQGLVFRVLPLLENDLIAALEQWAKLYQVHLPADVLRYLLQHLPREPGLQRKFLRLLAEETLLKQQRITLPLVKNCLREKADALLMRYQ